MKIPNRPISPRVATLALLGLAVLSARAQTDPRHTPVDPVVRKARDRSLGRADALVAQAREAMRKGQLDRATTLAQEGADDMTALGGADYAGSAREVLAETALLQDRPADALREIATLRPELVKYRLAVTKALALVGVGRLGEARAMVLKEIGTPEAPTSERRSEGLYHFPTDGDPSAQALTATALMIRATCWRWSPEYPETIADFRAALRLAPHEATLRLECAESLSDLGAYDEAKAELAKVDVGTDPRVKEMMKTARLYLAAGLERDPGRYKRLTSPPATPDKP